MIEITLNKVNLKTQYGMVLEEFDIGLPEPKLVSVDVPGRDGKLDMSRALTGFIHYHNRDILLQMGITGEEDTCESRRQQFMSMYHMQDIHLRFSHLNGYFIGRLAVEKVTREKAHYTLHIRVICEPYRYNESIANRSVTLTSSVKVEQFSNDAMPAEVTIQTTQQATIEFENKRHTVQTGKHRLGIVFKPGWNTLKLSGSGIATITYQTGVL